MTLTLAPNDPTIIRNLAKTVDVFVIDIDDTAYHVNTGLHHTIKQKILDEALGNPKLNPLLQSWSHAGTIAPDGQLALHDLGWAFPKLLDHYRNEEPNQLTPYLTHVYDVDYSVIPPDPVFVQAINTLRNNEKRIVIYTNGPWSPDGNKLHANNVLERLGFGETAFGEDAIVDLIKVDRNLNLLEKFNIPNNERGRVFDKTTPEGFERMAKALGFTPDQKVAYIDDSARNLESANPFGCVKIKIALSPDELKAPSPNHLTVWSDEKDPQKRPLSTAGQLLDAVAQECPPQKIPQKE